MQTIKEIRRSNFIAIRTAHAAALVDLGALTSSRGSLRIIRQQNRHVGDNGLAPERGI